MWYKSEMNFPHKCFVDIINSEFILNDTLLIPNLIKHKFSFFSQIKENPLLYKKKGSNTILFYLYLSSKPQDQQLSPLSFRTFTHFWQ